MREGWEIISFDDSIEQVKYTPKITTSDYQKTGIYPIISQEEEYISGYWSNESDVFKPSRPLVVFGDHTRVLKYIDFNFVLGADGIKILQPIDKLNAKFFLYFLKSCKIPSLGYSRHYKLLRELNVPIPPLPEQQKIVEELDCLSNMIELKKKQLKTYDKLAQAIFYDMFGDPIANDKGWDIQKLENIGTIVTGSTPSTNDISNWDGDINWITPAELGVQLYYGETTRKLTEKGAKGLTLMPKGTVILSTRAPIGKLAITTVPMCCNQGFKNIICGDNINNIYLYYYLMYTMDKIKLLGRGVTFKEVSKSAIADFGVVTPPLTNQQQFAEKIEAIENQKKLVKKSLQEVETLFNSRMDYYFN